MVRASTVQASTIGSLAVFNRRVWFLALRMEESMTFSLTLELEPGTTYSEIKRQVERVASRLPDDGGRSKPDFDERIVVHVPGTVDRPRIIGEWRIVK